MRASYAALSLALAALLAGRAAADEPKPSPSPVPSTAEPAVLPARVIEFGRGAARLHVVSHDTTTGAITVTVTDPAVHLSGVPVVLLRTDGGPRTLAFTPVEGQERTWRLSDALLRRRDLDGTVRIVIGDKTYEAPFPAATTVVVAPRHGGRVVTLDCGPSLEVVRDVATGTMTLYAPDGTSLGEAPAIFLPETKDPQPIGTVAVEGQPGTFRLVHSALKSPLLWGRVRLRIDGRSCEADISDGRLLEVEGGPRLQLAPTKGAGTYFLRVLDKRDDGREFAFESPRLTMVTKDGDRSVPLVPVEGEARTYRLVLPEGVKEGMVRFILAGTPHDVRITFGESGR